MMNNEGIIKTKKDSSLYVGVLTILLLLTYIFTLKFYEPAANIYVTGGILFYPITFLILILIYKDYGFKIARKSILTSVILFILFILGIMISSLFSANTLTSSYDSVVQYVFVNNVKLIGNLKLYYPTLGQFFGTIIAYITSHLIFITIYNAIKSFAADYLSISLAIFISYILDRIIFMPIFYMNGLMNGSSTFDYFIKCLTSEFIFTILASLIFVIAYVIIDLIKKMFNKN